MRSVDAPCPGPQQIPGAQTQLFGDQQPYADKMATHLVGQHLPHAAFDARGSPSAMLLLATLRRLDGEIRFFVVAGAALVEFFFEARNRR